MKTIPKNQTFKGNLEAKRSKFHTIIQHINSKEELESFLLENVNPDATHNCYAYRLGVEVQTGGYQDDGEPKRSAGFPIFKVIEQEQLTNIVVLVIRFYGGIKLGVSTLTRTYRQAAISTLKDIKTQEIKLQKIITIMFMLAKIKEVDLYCHQNQLQILSKEFAANNVTYTLQCEPNFDFNSDLISVKITKNQVRYL